MKKLLLLIPILLLFGCASPVPNQQANQTHVSGANATNGSQMPSNCFAVPYNPTKAQVLYYINLARTGTGGDAACSLGALQDYQEAGILANYSININLTDLANNITGLNGSVYNCPAAPYNPTRADILRYINATNEGDGYGYCALAALNEYDRAGILAGYGISVDLTALQKNLAAHPSTYTMVSLSTSISDGANITELERNADAVMQYYDAKAKAVRAQAQSNATPISSTKSNATSISSSVILPNWAGYVVSAWLNTIYVVKGSWKIQSVFASTQPTYSVQWVGIGGYSSGDNTLIQTGTESDYYNGQAHYLAWYEMLPATAIQLPKSVAPGDTVWAMVYLLPGTSNQWNITIADLTPPHTWTYYGVFSYSSSSTSAEWIDERPLINGAPSNLANFSGANYGLDYTGVANTSSECDRAMGCQTMGWFSPTELIMANSTGHILATPSAVTSDGTSFKVIRN